MSQSIDWQLTVTTDNQSAVKLAFHDADTDTNTDTDTDFLADILARIIARMSVPMSVSVSTSWNASLIDQSLRYQWLAAARLSACAKTDIILFDTLIEKLISNIDPADALSAFDNPVTLIFDFFTSWSMHAEGRPAIH